MAGGLQTGAYSPAASAPDADLDEPAWWPARKVAAAIASGQIGAVEYLQLLLARVQSYNSRLNLVVTVDERALDAARLADDLVRRGARLGRLHGVAMTVKDCLATRGLRTTAGMAVLGSYLPRRDASVVAALRRAGAIVFGKTNLAEASGDLQSANPLFGLAANPWHPQYTPGGSTGGGAGAVAAGLTPLELGSDVAGSIRIPAANCGVFAHKPSFGVVPVDGHLPPAPFRARELDLNVIGPLARDVDDLELALSLIAEPRAADRPAWRLSLPPPRPIRRVATWFDDPYCPVEAQLRQALERVAARLAEYGVDVQPAHPPGVRLDTSDAQFQRLLATVSVLDEPDGVEEIAAGRRHAGAGMGARFVTQRYWDWAEADDRRQRLRQRWHQFFDDYDAILLPVMANLTPAHDTRPLAQRTVTVNGMPRPYWSQIVWAGLTGVSYLPSTVVPIGRDSRGLPIALAVAADYLQDRTALAAARLVAQVADPVGRPDLTIWQGSG